VEVGLQPVQQLGEEGLLGADLQGPSVGGRRGRSIVDDAVVLRTPRCVGRKRGVQSNALGRSRGGFSTKLHAVVDTKGRPIYIAITPGQRHEMMKADELLANAPGKAFIADAGYDSNRFRQAVRDRKKRAVIGSKPNRPRKLPKSRALYSRRYLVECFFHNLKRFRAIATRFEKTARNFLALTQLACAYLWLASN
jgi:transposase